MKGWPSDWCESFLVWVETVNFEIPIHLNDAKGVSKLSRCVPALNTFIYVMNDIGVVTVFIACRQRPSHCCTAGHPAVVIFIIGHLVIVRSFSPFWITSKFSQTRTHCVIANNISGLKFICLCHSLADDLCFYIVTISTEIMQQLLKA